ncbi:MAG: ribosome biogenesis GTP-binding protein YihA/YsxC [Desulfovibrio sp.]|jgi:GTP-binding protein|nr:ribosome biogenesis GTP-binding protein YihA/YsxC [Desulfovibrio sp.]
MQICQGTLSTAVKQSQERGTRRSGRVSAQLSVRTAFTVEQLVLSDVPQAALAGRSNVGKSSLLNALSEKGRPAKVSSMPGKTRSVNFYQLWEEDAYIVDLPGYGHAQRAKAERVVWGALAEYYLRHSKGLQLLILLLDARLPPQQSDLVLQQFAVSLSLPLLPVLTKVDKCSRRELDACMRAWTAIAGREPLRSSARIGLGIAELRTALRDVLL